MNFMEAMDAVEAGHTVCREAWGSDVYVFLQDSTVKIEECGQEAFGFDVDLEDVFGEDWDLVV